MSPDFIKSLFSVPEMLEMGHDQRVEDGNLGLGWLYYALVRILRPKTTVCIGSWRGYVPVILGKGNDDNLEKGDVIFIDPSLVDEQWRDQVKTQGWFSGFGVSNIHHHQMTTQEFVQTEEFAELGNIDLLFVDGLHTAEQARFDHEAFERLLSEKAIVLFHDSVRYQTSYMYGEDNPYEHSVVDYMAELKQREDLQVFDFPFDSGVTMVRKNLNL